jgi:predicted nuclease of predicted toxin-antitoxin system
VSRVLLDEGVPRRLAKALRDVGIKASAFPNDWKQLSNGALLAEAERHGFQVLITNDKRMSYQQNLIQRNMAVLILPTQRRLDILLLVPRIVAVLDKIEPKQFLVLD